MAPNRDDIESDGTSRDHSRPRDRRSSRSKPRYDRASVDSGYAGSSLNTSPQSARRRAPDDRAPSQAGSPGMPKDDAARASTGGGEEADSDSSDYDPRSKYYLTVDDSDYKNISFQGGEPSQPGPRNAMGQIREGEDDSATSRRRSSSDRHRYSSRRRHSSSMSPSESDAGSSFRHQGRLPQETSSRRYSDSSRPKPRRDSTRRPLSPILSDHAEDWHTSPERRDGSRAQSITRGSRRSRNQSASSSDHEHIEPLTEDAQRRRSEPRRTSRVGSSRASRGDRGSRKGGKSERGSSSYKGAADMDDAWYKTFKERLTNGVDMAQVKKVGLDAAAVAAVKVAVGTQLPWKQRIPKTIAVGLAAAVTDFLVSKTSVKPKGMVGTMFARQFVEIALANLIINPTSNKMQQKFSGKKAAEGGGGQGANAPAGGRARLGASATAGRGRR